jgi:hypothetical protein
MPTIDDQDRFFVGEQNASTPKALIPEGTIARLINGRFVEGAISNGIGFDELDLKLLNGASTFIKRGNITYGELLKLGDLQLVAPLQNTNGHFLFAVISGVLFQIDVDDLTIRDVTPTNSFLISHSSGPLQLSYLSNDGGISGSGGYLVIFNFPNKSILINQDKARLASVTAYEMPPSRMGVTAAVRAFIITGDNIMLASDPYGGSNPLAPLTFEECLRQGADFYGQFFTIGSALDLDKITSVVRMPRLLGPSQPFLAQSILVSTETHKYIISAGMPRASWDAEGSGFIVYAGTSEGIAGPLSATNVGSSIVYTASTGRIKTFSQELEKENSLSENYFDNSLGQYAPREESDFHFRKWYETLDHSRSIIRYNRNRIYATVYPSEAPALNRFNEDCFSKTHRALAIGSLDPESRIGSQAAVTWEGFYDWLNPVGVVTLGTDLYVVSKSDTGLIQFFKENTLKRDDHQTTIYTRGYFAQAPGLSRTLTKVFLRFRRLAGPIKVTVSYLVDGKWVVGNSCTAKNKFTRIPITNKNTGFDTSIALRIDIDHKGCAFELESIRAKAEAHREEKTVRGKQ